jgi:ribonuclease G
VYEEIKQYLNLIAPEASKVVKLYKGDQPIFDKFDITRQMKTGLGRTVGFKKGGYLIMDKTEALFSIDVNSGSKKLFADQEQNAFHFNMLAADEIVHQLRLRDIGGIIVVHFIAMDDKGNQQAFYDHMRELMSHDRAEHNILPLSKVGLMQITRQRVRPAVEMEVMETCPTCLGKGKIQASLSFTEQIEEQLEAMVAHYGRGLLLHLHPFIYAYISKGWISTKRKWTWKYGVRVIENQKLGMLDAPFFDRKGVQQHLPNTEDKAPEKQ